MYIAVASGKGGTGKTLVSTSLALCAENSTYIDLDVEEPNGHIFLNPVIEKELRFSLPAPAINEALCTFCGKCAGACVFNALAIIPSGPKTLFFPELCHSCGVCNFVCPVSGAIEETRREIGVIRSGYAQSVGFVEGRLNVGQPSGVPLIDWIVANYIDSSRLTIVDSSPGTACPVVESIKKSDFVLLVTEPTPFGLNDLTLTVELINSLGKSAAIILNKDTGKNRLIDDFASKAGIPVVLRIPYSTGIQESYSKGIPFIVSMPEMKKKFRSVLDYISAII